MREPLGIWEIADAYPHRMAVHTTEGQSLSFGELCARVNRLSRCLRDLGLTPGAFIVVVAGNAVDVLALQLATLQLNAYFVPLDIRWTGVEVSETLRTLRPAIFAVDGFAAEAGKQAEGIVRPAGGVRMSRVEVIIELANTYPSCALADRKY